jgi:hypothetical protein
VNSSGVFPILKNSNGLEPINPRRKPEEEERGKGDNVDPPLPVRWGRTIAR